MHILVSVRVPVTVIVAVRVSMIECHDSDKVDEKTRNTHRQ